MALSSTANYAPSSPNALCHYGVLGMKWGVRKDRETSINDKKKMSMRKKVLIGMVATAAILGSAHGALKIIDDKKEYARGVAYGKDIADLVLSTENLKVKQMQLDLGFGAAKGLNPAAKGVRKALAEAGLYGYTV